MAGTPLYVLLCCCMTGIVLAQKGCRNPEGVQGKCIEINNCPPLYSLFNSRPLSSQTIEFLRRSQCGFNGRTPLVCCVESANQTSHTYVNNITKEETPSAGFDLQSHPKAGLLPLDTCGASYINKIWGGDVAGMDEFPWLALLQYRTRSSLVKFLCGGVLISKRYVLTAAHCLHFRELGSVLTMVRLGEFNLESDPDCETVEFNGQKQCAPKPQDFGIEESIPHPGFDPVSNNKHNDIGLVRLDRDANLDTDNVQPICLPASDDVPVSQKFLVAGWGFTEKRVPSPLLLKAEVPVVSDEECGKQYANGGHDIGQGQLCAGGVSGKGSCKGDSGGPLMYWAKDARDGKLRYNVAGIISNGSSPCGLTGWPGVYTKVFHYIPWILDTIKP